MNSSEHGVLQQSSFVNWPFHLLLLIIFSLCQHSYADTNAGKSGQSKINPVQHHHITLIYSSDNSSQFQIANKLKEILLQQDKTLDISEIASSRATVSTDTETDLVVVIERHEQLEEQLQNAGKLLIASNPATYQPDTESTIRNAVLFMTQPYCRQIPFIRQINDKWQTIGYLNSQNHEPDHDMIRRCAMNHHMSTYQETVSSSEQLTNDIKSVLSKSDLILAMPDKDIYNRKTVKNILLTSYRYRKPVIAFSQNFVTAGALAAIHSSTEQIAQTAARLVIQYFDSGQKFSNSINYPEAFDISFNRQVFRALDLVIPDPEKIRQAIKKAEKSQVKPR